MRIEIMKKIPHRLIFLFFNIYRLKRKKRRELKNDSNNNIGFLPGHWLTYLNSKNTVKFVYSKKKIMNTIFLKIDVKKNLCKHLLHCLSSNL